MAVYFNDLTIVKGDPHQNCRLLSEFWKLMKKLKQATDGREDPVIANEDALLLGDAVFASGNPELRAYYGTFFSRAYQDEGAKDLMARAAEHTGGEAEYRIGIGAADPIECKMLGWSHHERSITLGLASSPFWNRLIYPVERMTLDEEEPMTVEAICVTNDRQIDDSRIQGWIVAQRDFENVVLPGVSAVPICEKRIHYRDDHGREILDAFARRLVKCEYVDGVINSTEQRRHCDQFIYDVRDDGIVYLCLHWYDEGYGLAVQTTARGRLQTQLVADVLRERFDRRS